MTQYRPGGFQMLPMVVKNLLIINGLFFLATFAFESTFGGHLSQYLGLHHYKSVYFGPWQIVTHMFMHGGIMHIFFNMFMLWMFGSTLENLWGPKRFLIFYMITGLGAAFLHSSVQAYQLNTFEAAVLAYQASPNLEAFMELYKNYVGDKLDSIAYDFRYSNLIDTWRSSPESTAYVTQSINLISLRFAHVFNMSTVGASGAVYGLLLAYGMLFPNTRLYIYFLFPVKAKYVVLFLGGLAIYMGFQNNPGDNIAHFAHLGGMLFGVLLIEYWRRSRKHFY